MRFPLSLLILFGLLAFIPDGSLLNHQSGQSAEQPKVVNASVPTYPPIAAAVHAFGKVVIEVEINAKGEVTHAQALSGHPLLYKASEEAAKRWLFESVTERESQRTLKLTFEFKNPNEASCKGKSVFINPYYVEITYAYTSVKPSDTVSYIPSDAEEKRCPVHGDFLKKDKVQIVYGLTEFRPGYLEAQEKFFPYANSIEYGGCVIETAVNPCDGTEVQFSPKYAEVLYCQSCRIAQAKWVKAHPWRRK